MSFLQHQSTYPIYLFFILLLLISVGSCAEEPELPTLRRGCTDPTALNYDPLAEENNGDCEYLEDKVTGDWEADRFLFDGDDLIASGFFERITFEFKSNDEFDWRGIPVDGNVFSGGGDWEIDDGNLEIKFDADSDTFCGDIRHRFEVDLDGDDKLNLEDSCSDGTNIVLELDRDN